MLADILIIVGVGISQLLVTVYTLIVSVKEERVKNSVITGLLGLFAIALSVVGVVRGNRAQGQLQGELVKIQKNTERPPQVKVDIPVPPQHTHVVFETPTGSVGQHAAPLLNPFGDFQKDDDLSLNVGFTNAGDYAARTPRLGVQIVVSPANDTGLFARMRNVPKMGGMTADLAAHTNAYRTFPGPKATEEQAQRLNSGKDGLCVLGFLLWRDDSGVYEIDQDICYIRGSGGNFNWYFGPENNKETKH